MKRKISNVNVTYEWWTDEHIPIPPLHTEALAEDAEERIWSQLKDGMVCGQLFTSVRFGQDRVAEEDAEERLSYTGWWKIER